jgi:hypothetical protein
VAKADKDPLGHGAIGQGLTARKVIGLIYCLVCLAGADRDLGQVGGMDGLAAALT